MSEVAQFGVDAPEAPSGILGGEPDDEFAQFLGQRWASWGGDQGAVWPAWLGSGDLQAQDRDLVSQDQYFGVLGGGGTGEQDQPREDPRGDQAEQSHERKRLTWGFAADLIRLNAWWNDYPLDRTRTSHLTRLEHTLTA
ncbi:hypothetical protein ACFV1F_32860 [Streptomyces sp. NPDC059590]|uniref:hypothetical protein n=1 Tax=unclassified Streptomyces TaxID=2593676 RepID=UPI0036A42158